MAFSYSLVVNLNKVSKRSQHTSDGLNTQISMEMLVNQFENIFEVSALDDEF